MFNKWRVPVYKRVGLLDERGRLQDQRIGPVNERLRFVYERVGLVYQRAGVGRYFPALPAILGEFSILIIIWVVRQGLGRVGFSHFHGLLRLGNLVFPVNIPVHFIRSRGCVITFIVLNTLYPGLRG
jgi:hypothetical protein